jgi:hypothetical protein
MRLALMAVIAMLSCFASPACACSEPSVPYCAQRYGAFDDEDEFNRCKREMDTYRSEADDFLACLRREADDLKRKSDRMIEEYNNTVETFNRRVRG